MHAENHAWLCTVTSDSFRIYRDKNNCYVNPMSDKLANPYLPYTIHRIPYSRMCMYVTCMYVTCKCVMCNVYATDYKLVNRGLWPIYRFTNITIAHHKIKFRRCIQQLHNLEMTFSENYQILLNIIILYLIISIVGRTFILMYALCKLKRNFYNKDYVLNDGCYK